MNDKEVIIKLAQYKLSHSPHTRKQYKKYIGESYSVNSDTEKIYDFALNNLPSIPNDSFSLSSPIFFIALIASSILLHNIFTGFT